MVRWRSVRTSHPTVHFPCPLLHVRDRGCLTENLGPEQGCWVKLQDLEPLVNLLSSQTRWERTVRRVKGAGGTGLEHTALSTEGRPQLVCSWSPSREPHPSQVSPGGTLPGPLLTHKSPLTPWGFPILEWPGPHLAVHVGFRPGDVMVMVDDHGPAQHMQVLHHVLLGICQRGDLRVVAWGGYSMWLGGVGPRPPWPPMGHGWALAGSCPRPPGSASPKAAFSPGQPGPGGGVGM